MNCESCSNPIDQGRLDWAAGKNFTIKYCKECGEKKRKEGGGYQKRGQRSQGEQMWIAWQAMIKAACTSGWCESQRDVADAAKYWMDEGIAYVTSKTPKE